MNSNLRSAAVKAKHDAEVAEASVDAQRNEGIEENESGSPLSEIFSIKDFDGLDGDDLLSEAQTDSLLDEELSALKVNQDEEPVVLKKSSTKKPILQKVKNHDVDIHDMLDKRIVKLTLDLLETDDSVKTENIKKLIVMTQEALESLQKKTIVQQKVTKVKEPRNVKNIKNILNMPVFQLEQDRESKLVDTKKTIHENPESFISTFEAVLDINDVDIDMEWKEYIAPCFLSSLNTAHTRFYKIQLQVLEKGTSWDTAKGRIMDQYDIALTLNKMFEDIIEMRQKKDESVRGFFDRYTEARLKLPKSCTRPTNTLDVVACVNKMLPITREAIKKCLAKDDTRLDTKNESHYPRNLDLLFSFLRKNVGEIQENIINSLNHGEIENNKRKRPTKEIELKQENNKKYKPTTEKKQVDSKLCNYCKEVDYTFAHMIKCPKYLVHEDYQKYLIRRKNKREQVQIGKKP